MLLCSSDLGQMKKATQQAMVIALTLVLSVGLILFLKRGRVPISTEGLGHRESSATASSKSFGLSKSNSEGASFRLYSEALISFDAADFRARQGFSNWAKGDLEEALNDFTEAIKSSPSNGNVFLPRGFLQIHMGNYKHAVDDLSEALRLIPAEHLSNSISTAVGLYGARGHAYLWTGQFDSAIDDLTQAIRLDRNRFELYRDRGHSYQSLGNLERAIADYSKAIELEPANYELYYNRGVAHADNEEWDEAILDFGKAIGIDGSDPRALAFRGYAYKVKGQLDDAINDYNAAVRLEPKNSALLQDRGLAYGAATKWREALGDFQQAIEIDPRNSSALNELAWLRATCREGTIRDGREAVKLAQKACELTDWREWGHVDTLACAYAEAGDFEMAVKYQKQAMESEALTSQDREATMRRLGLYEKRQPYREDSGHQKGVEK